MLRKEETHLNIIPIVLIIILAVSIGVASTTLTGFGKLGIAQGGDKHVNTTESKICGIPKSQPSNTTTSSEENITPEGIAPPEPPSEG